MISYFKIWQNYPAALGAALAPWVTPFTGLDWINTRWRPIIDAIGVLVALFYLIYLNWAGYTTDRYGKLGRTFVYAIIAMLVTAGICYAFANFVIHKVDPDYLWLWNIPWAVAYVLFYPALVHALIAGLRRP